MKDETLFLNYIAAKYDILKRKYREFCRQKDYSWDEDIFQDTILKCHDTIKKKGKLADTSNQGIENYFFRSFKQNIQREKQYARNMKRDLNIPTDTINDIYEVWYNDNNITSESKLKSDLYKDFATLYIMYIVSENFDEEHFYLFKLKTLCELTYKEISSKTQSRGCRQKVLTVKTWLKENLKKEDVIAAFYDIYGNLL